MLVQVNTSNNVDGAQSATAAIEERVRERLARLADRLTRVEVHVEDADGTRNGPAGIAVRMEARPAGGQPLIASASGREVEGTANDALRKLVDVLDRNFGRQAHA